MMNLHQPSSQFKKPYQKQVSMTPGGTMIRYKMTQSPSMQQNQSFQGSPYPHRRKITHSGESTTVTIRTTKIPNIGVKRSHSDVVERPKTCVNENR